VFSGESFTIETGGNFELRHFGGVARVGQLSLAGRVVTHGTGRTVGMGATGELIAVPADSRIVVVRNSQTLEVRSRLTGSAGLMAQGTIVGPGDRATIALLGVGNNYSGA
jgi:hypothetical protein